MKVKLFFPIIVLLLSLTTCNSKKLSLIPKNGTILAFGDSLTFGKGVDISNSYPRILAELSGRKVINAGITGEITSEGLLRFPKILKDIKPNLIILLEGGNDILRDLDLSITKNNLSKMIGITREQDIPVVLVAVPDGTETGNPAHIYIELAGQYNLLLEKGIIGRLLVNPVYKSDKYHFNKAGYHLLAKTLYRLLKKNGAL